MDVCSRLRAARESKNLSQGDIERKTGLLRCYISRVENGHTVPSLETLQKLCRACDMQLYQLLYDGDQPPAEQNHRNAGWGSVGKSAKYLSRLRRSLSSLTERERDVLLHTLKKMVQAKNGKQPD